MPDVVDFIFQLCIASIVLVSTITLVITICLWALKVWKGEM